MDGAILGARIGRWELGLDVQGPLALMLGLSVTCIAGYYFASSPAKARLLARLGLKAAGALPSSVELPAERFRRLARLFGAMCNPELRAKRYSEHSAAHCALVHDRHFGEICSLAEAAGGGLSIAQLEPLVALLGRGAFSAVELRRVAGDAPCHAGALFAVKRLLAPTPETAAGPGDAYGGAGSVPAFDMVSLMAEGALLRILQHPNIIACHGASVPHGLLLEYAPGGSLRQRIDARDYGPAEALGWLVGVARALAYLHGLAGLAVVHRDLKPANVLVGADGSAKLCDFGLFRLLPSGAPPSAEPPPSPERPDRPEPQAAGLTARTGTYAYMAPELWDPRADYDERVDLFAFGVLAWEVLTMRLAYADLDAEPERVCELVATRGMRPYVPLRWPAPLRLLLRGCFSADPAQRPSARRAFHALESLQRDASVDRALCDEALAVRQLPCATVFEQSS